MRMTLCQYIYDKKKAYPISNVPVFIHVQKYSLSYAVPSHLLLTASVQPLKLFQV